MGKLEVINGDNDTLLGGRFLTLDELSVILKIKPKTLRQWVYQGRIPNLKINGLLRFERRDIEAWLLSQRRSGQQQQRDLDSPQVGSGLPCSLKSQAATQRHQVSAPRPREDY